MLYASKQGGVESFVYAASSSTYGDHPDLPKKEEKIGNPLSPYAVTKLVNEIYASVFSITYSFHSIGLRYFNVYGKYQSKNSSYAAVIPKWINLLTNNETIRILGIAIILETSLMLIMSCRLIFWLHLLSLYQLKYIILLVEIELH